MGDLIAYRYNNATPKNPEWAKNWGDIIAPTIIKHFSEANVVSTSNYHVQNKIISIGSVFWANRQNDIIWGTGIQQAGDIGDYADRVDIRAVRGPLTRNELLKVGIECPEIYGDPGLLYPLIYKPTHIQKTHKFGLIPHYIDLNHPNVKLLENAGFKIIDILAGETEFIDQLLSVNIVFSSSLHGLIAADAYGIPNTRIKFSDKLVGGDFKFQDYASSVNRNTWQAIDAITPGKIELNSLLPNIKIDWDPEPLLKAAPWI